MVHVSTHTLHYGTGVFEGLRCYETDRGPAVFRLQGHLDRFYLSAAMYGMKIPYSEQILTQAIHQVIEANGFKSCYIRPICYAVPGNLGIRADYKVSVAILAWPWANHLGERGTQQ